MVIANPETMNTASRCETIVSSDNDVCEKVSDHTQSTEVMINYNGYCSAGGVSCLLELNNDKRESYSVGMN